MHSSLDFAKQMSNLTKVPADFAVVAVRSPPQKLIMGPAGVSRYKSFLKFKASRTGDLHGVNVLS